MPARLWTLVLLCLGLGCGDWIDFTTSFPTRDDGVLGRSTTEILNGRCTEVDSIARDPLVVMLDTQRYDDLDVTLNRFVEAYRQNALCEARLRWTWSQLVSTDDARLDALSAWVEASPRSVAARTVRAWAHMDAGYAARGRGISRNTPRVNFDRMHAHHARAIEDLTEAIAIDPSNPIPVDVMASVRRASGGCRDARVWLERHLEVDPRSYYARRETIRACEPEWGGSLDAMQSIAEKAQSHADANPMLGVLPGFPIVYRALRGKHPDWASRIALLSEALRYGDDRVTWIDERARQYIESGQYEAALADADRAIRIAPDCFCGYVRRGSALAGLGRLDEAFAAFEDAIRMDPNAVRIYQERSKIYAGLHRSEDKAADYRRLTELVPHNAWSWSKLGFTLVDELGRPDEGEVALRRAIELKPDKPTDWFFLALALERQERADEAVEPYRRFLELAERTDFRGAAHLGHARAFLRAREAPEAAASASHESLPGLGTIEGRGRAPADDRPDEESS